MELDLKFEKLITKEARYESSNLSMNLLISRLQRKYSMNQTPENLKSCVSEMRAFFDKYAKIVQKDVEAIKGL